MKRPFRKYQSQAFSYILSRKNSAALYKEMRLGKTLVVVRATKYKQEFPALIVAPYSALKGWKDEIIKEGLTFSKVTGDMPEKKKLDAIKTKADFYLTNKETFMNTITKQWITNTPWKSIVLDEITFIKNPKARVSKFWMKFIGIGFRYGLTGTPAPESDLDYIPQLIFLKMFPYDSFWGFRAKHCKVGNMFKWTIKNDFRNTFNKILKDNCFFMSRKQAGYTTPKIYQCRSIRPIEKNFYKQYKEIFDEMILSVNGQKETTIFSSDSWHWTRKLCSGFVKNVLIYSHKYKECKYLLETELQGQSIIIFCEYTHEIEILQKIILRKCAVITGETKQDKRNALVNDFQSEKIKLLIVQSVCMRYGQDLSKASTCIFFSSPLSQETRLQNEDRLISLNKSDSVLYIDLVTENTIEEDIYNAMQSKTSLHKLAYRIYHNA